MCQVVKMGQNRSKWVRIGQNRSKWVRISQNRSKCVICLNFATIENRDVPSHSRKCGSERVRMGQNRPK